MPAFDPRSLAGRVALLAALSFFASGIPRALTFSAGEALFLQRYGADWLPAIYVGAALAVPLVGLVLVRAQKSLPMIAALGGTILLDMLMQGGLWLGLRLDPQGPAGAILGLWVYVQWVFTSLAIWAPAAWIFNVRESRRAYGYVAAGGLLAQAAGGLAVPPLLAFLAPADLLLISAGSSVVGLGLLWIILRRHPAPPVEEPEPTGTPEAEPASASMTRAIFLLAAFSQFTYYVTENAFFQQAHHRYADESELTAFLGYVSASEGLLSVVVSLLTTWAIARFGLRGTLTGLPGIALAGGSFALALAMSLGSYHPAVFWTLTGLYLADCCLRYTLDKSGGLILYHALAPGARAAIQTRAESMVEPVACGIAGIVLLVAIKLLGFETGPLLWMLVLGAALWGGAALRAFRRFVDACAVLARPEPVPGLISPERRQGWLALLAGAERPVCRLDHEDALAQRIAARTSLRSSRVPADPDMLQAKLIRGAEDLAILLDLRAILAGRESRADRALATALDHEILECRDHLVVLAALHDCEPRLKAVRKALLVRDRSRLAYALEALDNLLSRAQAMLLLPLIEEAEERQPTRSLSELTDAILARGTAGYSPWLLASLVRHAGETAKTGLADRIRAYADHPDPVLARTAEWVLSSLAPSSPDASARRSA